MSAPTLFLHHVEPLQSQHLIQHLESYGIRIQPLYYFENLSHIFEKDHHNDCLLLNASLCNIQPLIQKGFFEHLDNERHATIFALVSDEASCRMIENHGGDHLQLYPVNVRLDKLIEKLLNHLQIWRENDVNERFALTLHGNTVETSLGHLLIFLQKKRFTGRVVIEKNSRNGLIHLLQGEIDAVRYDQLPHGQALNELARGNAKFQVEQRLADQVAFQDFQQTREIEYTPEARDILIDLFYFMHMHFEESIPAGEISQIVDSVLELEDPGKETGVYLIYNAEWQEKIQIIGNLKPADIPGIVAVYTAIFQSLSDKTTTNGFDQFINSLDEIKPFLQHINLIPHQQQQNSPLSADAEILQSEA